MPQNAGPLYWQGQPVGPLPPPNDNTNRMATTRWVQNILATQIATLQAQITTLQTQATSFYGELTVTANASSTNLTTAGTWYQLSSGWALGNKFAGISGNISSGTLTSTSSLTFNVATILSASVLVGTANQNFYVGIAKNNIILTEHQFEVTTTNTAVLLAGAAIGLDSAAPGDVFSIWAQSATNSTTITLVRANFDIFRLV